MKGIEQRISPDELLHRTSYGYDILMYYNGAVKRSCKSPFRNDGHCSFGFFFKNGTWMWKDLTTEEVGNAITFVQKKFGLTYDGAKRKIQYDFGMGGVEINPSPIKITWQKPLMTEDYIFIGFSSKKFGRKHHEFWNIAGVSEEWCNKFECWAVKDAVKSNPITKKRERIPIGNDEIVFAYYCPEEDGVKLYFPEREKGNKFRTNVSGSHLWNFDNVGACENIVIQKSNKDMIVTALFTECVSAVQSENIGVFWNEGKTELAERVDEKGKHVFLSYGSDEDGKNKSIKLSKLLNWKWVNPPNKFLPDVNDVYSLAAIQGLSEVEKMFKNKKII